MTTKININGIHELDFPTGVSSATVANGVVTINLSGGSGGSGGVNVQTSNYPIVSGDAGKIVVMNGTSLTATLPNPAPSSTFAVFVANISSTNVTISRNSLLIDGAASNLTLLPSQGVYISTDGTNYFTERGMVPVVTTGAPGLAPTLPGSNTVYLDGTGNYTTPPGTGGGNASSVTTTSQSYTAGQTVNFTLAMAKSFMAWKVTEATNQPFRLQLYQTSAARTADASRPYSVPLLLGQGSGVLLDLYLPQTGNAVTPFFLMPNVFGTNGDATPPVTSNIYASVTNLSGSTQTIAVTINFVIVET